MNLPVPVVGPELKSVSPSQIKTFQRCPRLHYLEKRCGLVQQEQEHLKLGTEVHGYMEDYYESGTLFTPPPAGERLHTPLSSALLLIRDEDMPKPAPGLLIETPRNYATTLKAAGVQMRMRSDLADPTNSTLTKLYDWKTSGRVHSEYSKTGEQLASDVQGVIYAKWAFEKFKPDAVIFAHGVIGTNEIEYDFIPTDPLTKEHVDGEYAQVESTVAEMKEHFKIEAFHQTKAEPSAAWGSPCRMYKGCAHVALCGVVLPEKKSKSTPEAVEEPRTMSLKARLATRARSTPAPELPAEPPTQPTGSILPVAGARAVGINPADAAKPAPVTPYVPPAPSETQLERALRLLAEAQATLAAIKLGTA